jgi:hypothetical protein
MTRDELAAEALASWTIKALKNGVRAAGRQELPAMSLPVFLRAFRNADGLPGGISLALVGFDKDEAKLTQLAKREAPNVFSHLAVDLHRAASWRNQRKKHPIVIAYARGRVTGVNTLKHFEQASSNELSLTLLDWAKTKPEFTRTLAHTKFLESLKALLESDAPCSFEQIRSFLEAWSQDKTVDGPRRALPALALFPDPNLFSDAGPMVQRLKDNFQLVAQLRDRTPGQMEAIRKRIEKKKQTKLSKSFQKLQSVRKNPTFDAFGAIPLDEALEVLRPKVEKPDVEDDPEKDPTPEDGPVRALDPKRMQQTCAGALLDDRDEELRNNADTLSKALRAALDSESDDVETDWECTLDVEGEQVPASGPIDRKFVTWVHQFCNKRVWGGLVESSVGDTRKALEDFDGARTGYIRPDALIRRKGTEYDMLQLLTGWEEDLATIGKAPSGLTSLWKRFRELREQLLESLDELTHFPLEWFAGDAKVSAAAEQYLGVAADLFRGVSDTYGAMHQENPDWTRLTLEGLLALDVVQVKVSEPDGRRSSRAVLLPTHPLHLWRYLRLSRILRGLGKDLLAVDRAAVIKEAGEAIHFLSVIYASQFPDSRGAGQILPVANDIYRLATFENLHNAYAGPDGQDSLLYAIERFAALNRQHVMPLRLMLVNPPQAGGLLTDIIVKLLDGRRRDFLPRVVVEVRGTQRQTARLQRALLFDTREREIIEDKLASGRLELLLDRTPISLEDLLDELKEKPVHIAAVFDEAPVSIRRGGAGLRLPMSPFCVRRKVRFQHRWNELRLEVTSGDPPFYEFLELVKHAEGSEGEGTPFAWPEAEGLKKAVDDTLAPDSFGAQWFFLADRVLPDEGEMQSQRLLRRREGQRQILLAARDYAALARLMLPTFEEEAPNLLMPTKDLQVLLAEGAHLLGAGLLDLVKSDGRVVPPKVIGLVGALLAARAYRRQYPDALLVSTDSQLARTWLRLGTQGERSDFFGIREEDGRIVAECIEVKTGKGKPRDLGTPEIEGARLQLTATLSAVQEGLGDTVAAEATGHYLAAPRNEMLKEVLVHGSMARYAAVDQRKKWAEWLEKLFGPKPEMPILRGLISYVAIGSAEPSRMEVIPQSDPQLRLQHITEVEIQSLLNPQINQGPEEEEEDSGPDDEGPDGGSNLEPVEAEEVPEPRSSGPNIVEDTTSERPESAGPIVLGTADDGSVVRWEPSINGNPHMMITGLPGMGKTTCLVSLCEQLAAGGITPIVFSYHDDIDEQLLRLFPNVSMHDCTNLGFNPMRVRADETLGHLENAGQLRDIFAAIFPELGDLQREAIRSALKETYEAQGWGSANKKKQKVPGFREFLTRLQQAPRPDASRRTLLARLGELDDYGFFKAASEVPSLLESDKPVVLQIHRTNNEAVQRAYASFAFYRIYQDMFGRGRKNRLTHAIIFDEAHKASKLKLIPTMAKECRKFGLSLILASQESRDFDSALFTAIANYLTLRVTEDTARHLAKMTVASDRQRSVADRLKQLLKYHALWLCEGRKSPIQIALRASRVGSLTVENSQEEE